MYVYLKLICADFNAFIFLCMINFFIRKKKDFVKSAWGHEICWRFVESAWDLSLSVYIKIVS